MIFLRGTALRPVGAGEEAALASFDGCEEAVAEGDWEEEIGAPKEKAKNTAGKRMIRKLRMHRSMALLVENGKRLAEQSIAESNRATDAELAHAGLESGALHTEEIGRAFGPCDAPLRLLQRAEDVLAFGFFESRNRGSRGPGWDWG